MLRSVGGNKLKFSFAIIKCLKTNWLRCDDFVNDLTASLDLQAFSGLVHNPSTEISTGSVDIADSFSKRSGLGAVLNATRLG